ncbi:MAG: hypothetical protein KY476_16710 [Planctomycetes bacterium]|nr:hypothetical protein [Planctomycetota bacterium]
MAATREQLDSFHEFASAQLDHAGVELTLQQLLDLWRIQNPTRSERAENVAAIREALDDMEAGDTGEDAANALEECRAGLSASAPTKGRKCS